VRHTIAFQATAFQAAPVDVQIEVPEGEEAPEPDQIPSAIIVVLGGPSVQVSAFVSRQDAENLMGAFTQAEPMRGDMPPEAQGWEPEETVLPAAMLYGVNIESLVGASVTPPHTNDEVGIVPHWTVQLQDADGSSAQLAVIDALCVTIIRTLSDIAADRLGEDEDASALDGLVDPDQAEDAEG
jgi:hypothetical protein